MTKPPETPRKAGEKERSRSLCYSEEEGNWALLDYLWAGCSSVTFERAWTIDPESGRAVWTVIVEATFPDTDLTKSP